LKKKKVIYKIGRNLLLYQKLENLLKYINYHNDFPTDITSLEKKNKILGISTLGSLITNLVNYDSDKVDKPIQIDIGTSSDYYKQKEEVLVMILRERNELVHHAANKFDMSTSKKCKKIGKKLNNQKNKLLEEILFFQKRYESINSCKKDFQNYLQSDEGKEKILEVMMQNYYLNHPITIALAKLCLTSKNTRVSLSKAGQELEEILSNEVSLIKKDFKSLKMFMIETKIFNIQKDKKINMLYYELNDDFKDLFK